MKERPINLRQHEVVAIRAGRQTQLRRVMKHQPQRVVVPGIGPMMAIQKPRGDDRWLWPNAKEACPFGQPGDRLWVRETTIRVEEHGYRGPVYVASDDGQACLEWGLAPAPDDCIEVEPHELRLRPSIHMPRSMSRITLEITGVRVEGVQSISDEDAIAEGMIANTTARCIRGDSMPPPVATQFADLWQQINGPGSWDANPWVWVVEFRALP